MSDARQPIFSISYRDGVTRRAVGHDDVQHLPSPVSAVMVTQEVMSVPALVMKILEPSTTHSGRRAARLSWVRAAASRHQAFIKATLPAFAQTPIRQPLVLLLLRGRKRKIGIMPGEILAATVMHTDESVGELLDGDGVRERVRRLRRPTARRSAGP